MIEKYYPGLVVGGIEDITPDMLAKHDIRGLILDIDNTLVPTSVKEPDKRCFNWINGMKAAGKGLCIVSNATRKRVGKFNEKLGLHTIHRAYKPSRKAFLKAAGLMGLECKNVAVVGDQLFTDIKGGNRSGMLTILVTPLDRNEILFVRLKRYPEKYILSRYRKSGGGRNS